MAYNDTELAIIDARIAKAVSFTRSMGTVVSRDANSNKAMCTLDGGALAIPVKVAGNINIRQDDRVGLELFGSEWVVMFTFGNGTYNEDFVNHTFTASYDTTSTSYSLVPEVPALSFVKDRGLGFTRIRFDLDCGIWSFSAASTVAIGVRATLTPGGSMADYDIIDQLMNQSASHYLLSDHLYVDGLFEGMYTFEPIWRRVSGTGTPTMDTNDELHLAVREVPLPTTT